MDRVVMYIDMDAYFASVEQASRPYLRGKPVAVVGSGKRTVIVASSYEAKRLGIKIAYLVNLLNPQVVIIGGGLEEAGEDFLNKIIITIKEWAFREETDDLKVIYSQLRENAVALGAASLVTQRVFAGLLL